VGGVDGGRGRGAEVAAVRGLGDGGGGGEEGFIEGVFALRERLGEAWEVLVGSRVRVVLSYMLTYLFVPGAAALSLSRVSRIENLLQLVEDTLLCRRTSSRPRRALSCPYCISEGVEDPDRVAWP
jgi:hypothetical protein